MTTKHRRNKLDDCLNCIYFREKCNGSNMYEPKLSARGVLRCETQKENMTAEEIDTFIDGELK